MEINTDSVGDEKKRNVDFYEKGKEEKKMEAENTRNNVNFIRDCMAMPEIHTKKDI